MRVLLILLLLFALGCTEKTPAGPQTIVALGDSLTAGHGLDPQDAYPAQLMQKLHAEGYTHYTVINEGVSGDTSGGGLSRLDDVIAHDPDLVIVTLGANDIKRGRPSDNLESNLETIITRLQEKEITVVLGGMQPLGKFSAFVDSPLTSMYSDLAEKHDVALIPFFLRGVAGNGQYNNADGIHPNKAGYAKIVEENVWPVLEEELV